MGNRPRAYAPSRPSMSRTVPLTNPPSSRAWAGLGRGSRSCTPAERRGDHPMPRPGDVATPFPQGLGLARSPVASASAAADVNNSELRVELGTCPTYLGLLRAQTGEAGEEIRPLAESTVDRAVH